MHNSENKSIFEVFVDTARSSRKAHVFLIAAVQKIILFVMRKYISITVCKAVRFFEHRKLTSWELTNITYRHLHKRVTHLINDWRFPRLVDVLRGKLCQLGYVVADVVSVLVVLLRKCYISVTQCWCNQYISTFSKPSNVNYLCTKLSRGLTWSMSAAFHCLYVYLEGNYAHPGT